MAKAISSLLFIFTIVLMNANPVFALQLTLDPPGDREFVRDLANILDEEDEARIKELCDALLTDKATPIIVVTIDSMSEHGGDSFMRIETFATLLFNQWEIGHAKLGKQNWNTGILLLISKNDRKARIELGAGWAREKNSLCQQIMDEQIIYHFKQGNFSQGIVAGVESLDKMARELELPSRPRPWWHYALILGTISMAIFTVISLIRNGSSGYAWLFWGVIFTIIGTVLYHALTNSSSSGGGFSGGSFGGGFSGGGGASGSW